MRALKIVTIGMGVLIVFGTMTLVGIIVHRITSRGAPEATATAPVPATAAAALDEPEGTRIAAIAAVNDRLAVQLQGGGADRIVLVDPRSGLVVGRISLSR